MAYQYENVKLEKGMYGQSGMSFLKVLESLDPSENYKGTAPAVGFSELVADGAGGVSKPGDNQNGSSYLVLSVDSAANKAVIKL